MQIKKLCVGIMTGFFIGQGGELSLLRGCFPQCLPTVNIACHCLPLPAMTHGWLLFSQEKDAQGKGLLKRGSKGRVLPSFLPSASLLRYSSSFPSRQVPNPFCFKCFRGKRVREVGFETEMPLQKDTFDVKAL